MAGYDISETIKIVNEHARGSISSLIDIYQNPDCLMATGFNKIHKHSYIQISYVTKGAVEFIIERQHYNISKGQAVFINSDRVHLARALKPGSIYANCCIYPEFLFTFLSGIDSHQYISQLMNNEKFHSFQINEEVEWQEKALLLFKEIWRLYEEQSFGFEMQVAAVVIQFWHLILCNHRELIANDGNKQDVMQLRLDRAIQFISQHYQDDLRLCDIAAFLGIQNEEVCRLFKKILNITCFEYIGNYRIMKSIDLLSCTDESISSIALTCGFGSFSYFTKYFKKRMGISPSLYRKQIKERGKLDKKEDSE